MANPPNTFMPYVPPMGQATSSETGIEGPKSDELEGMLKSLMTEMKQAPAQPSWGPKDGSTIKYQGGQQESSTQPEEIEGMLRNLMTELRKNKTETGKSYWDGCVPSTMPRLDFNTANALDLDDDLQLVGGPGAPAPADIALHAELDALGDALEAELARKQHQ
mmetsp:Transcript_136948/g.238036  ORF Transcript_136948/g.238036 Transcript_136948/m.238036 type:complete len:163 (-) Transcript_136948:1660-2148(-)